MGLKNPAMGSFFSFDIKITLITSPISFGKIIAMIEEN